MEKIAKWLVGRKMWPHKLRHCECLDMLMMEKDSGFSHGRTWMKVALVKKHLVPPSGGALASDETSRGTSSMIL